MHIDYARMARSIQHYSERGFKPIEVPWTVSMGISELTRPADRAPGFELKHKPKEMVGSAEQGFLYLRVKGFLPDGMYQAVTPCFRQEPFDLYHSKYFLKNELFICGDFTEAAMEDMVGTAALFFDQELSKLGLRECGRVETSEGYDLNYREHELGSYGIRRRGYLKWIYGTGLAEPRFSLVTKSYT